MGDWKTLVRVAFVLAAAASVHQAMAQATYRCTRGSQAYYSDRPCKQELGAIGPAPSQREPAYQQSYIPSVGKAPEHLKYMSASCASLHDAIRTGPARGLTSRTMQEMRSEFDSKCRDDERAAMQQHRDDERLRGNEQRTQQMTQQAERRREQDSREQCNELLRILSGKRRQFDAMTPGEKADFQRFEANYNQRCRAG